MEYEWDEAKRLRNLAKHGIDFAAAAELEWDSVVLEPDLRRDYGELRLRAQGLIGGKLHILVFTRRGPLVRVISLRKASRKEKAEYEEGSARATLG